MIIVADLAVEIRTSLAEIGGRWGVGYIGGLYRGMNGWIVQRKYEWIVFPVIGPLIKTTD